MNGKELRDRSDAMEFGLPSIVAAAHELKSPLALMRQLALSLDGDLTEQQMRRISERIELTSDRALRLVDDLSHAQRLQDGLFDLEPVNPLALCDEVVQEITPLYTAHSREIRAVRRRKMPLVVANRSLLRRVIIGFADNALHYSFDGMPVVLETHLHGDMVRISVRDRGPGVSASLKNSLRAKPTLQPPSRRPASSGLGLYVARQFAEAMNGRVGVTRHRDGASFFIELNGSTQLSWL